MPSRTCPSTLIGLKPSLSEPGRNLIITLLIGMAGWSRASTQWLLLLLLWHGQDSTHTGTVMHGCSLWSWPLDGRTVHRLNPDMKR